MKNSVKIFLCITAAISVLAILFFGVRYFNRLGRLDGFAKCLDEKGAIFYGAFWCPHCQKQKEMFGKSAKLLPYVECSTPDGKAQLDVCKEKGVVGYPTWIFADGSRETGEVPFVNLSEKTGCELPKNQ